MIIAGDFHFPFEDKKAVQVFLKTVRRLEPTHIILNGDVADCYSLSDFDRDPSRKADFTSETKSVIQFLKQLRGDAPKAEIHYTEGNHEDRFRRLIWRNIPDLEPVLKPSLSEVFGLPSLKIQWHSYGCPLKIGHNFFIHHGDVIRKEGGATALALMHKTGANILCNHTHRLAFTSRTSWAGTISGWENGCLSSLKPSYIRGTPNWQQGFSIVEFSNSKPLVYLLTLEQAIKW